VKVKKAEYGDGIEEWHKVKLGGKKSQVRRGGGEGGGGWWWWW